MIVECKLKNGKGLKGIEYENRGKLVLLVDNIEEQFEIHFVRKNFIESRERRTGEFINIKQLNSGFHNRQIKQVYADFTAKLEEFENPKDGKMVFQSLSKYYPVKWKKNTIIILDDIQLRYPYTTCTGNNKALREKVQSVLDSIHRK